MKAALEGRRVPTCVIAGQMDATSQAAEREELVEKEYSNQSDTWRPGHPVPTQKSSRDPCRCSHLPGGRSRPGKVERHHREAGRLERIQRMEEGPGTGLRLSSRNLSEVH